MRLEFGRNVTGTSLNALSWMSLASYLCDAIRFGMASQPGAERLRQPEPIAPADRTLALGILGTRARWVVGHQPWR
jgi:hypothetical protein